MKLCSINCETKSHNLPLATYISGKIIFHALIYTVSFYWVASCAVSIKSTEDGWESHLKSENTNHRFICLVERKMFHESQLPQLQLNYFCKTPEKKILQSWLSCMTTQDGIMPGSHTASLCAQGFGEFTPGIYAKSINYGHSHPD